MSKSRSIVAGLLFASLLIGVDRGIATSAHTQTVHRTERSVVRLRAASGASIEFRTQNNNVINGIPPEIRQIPHLVLHRDGRPTDSQERTLYLSVSDVSVPPGESNLTLVIETQHVDPEQSEYKASRIQVWHDSRQIVNPLDYTHTIASIEFAVEFLPTLHTDQGSFTTPTDYYRYRISLSNRDTESKTTLHTQDHAFLMEAQATSKLPALQETTEDAAPDGLIVYYCDMIRFQNCTSDACAQLARASVPTYIQDELIPRMVEAVRVETNEWGYPWHEAWTSYRRSDGERVGVVLSDGVTWYHGIAPHDGHAGISLNVTDNMGCTHYRSLTERLIGAFYHELYHNLQRNLTLHYGRRHESAGRDDAWRPFSEGTASLASAIGAPETELDTDTGLGHYVLNANRFIGTKHTSGALNTSYTDIRPYELALYWKFLHDRCNQMATIHDVLDVLYSGEIVDIDTMTDVVRALPAVVDRALTNKACDFATHRESLSAFARAIYALRLQGGRCNDSDTTDCPGFVDPQHRYHAPPVSHLAYAGGRLTYSAAAQPAPAGIPSSYGMDFIEINLAQPVDGRSLTVEVIEEPGAAATFSAQAWELTVDGRVAMPVRDPITLTAGEQDHLSCRIPGIDWRTTQRIALIIVRTDPLEAVDPVGAYTVVLRSNG